MSEKSKPTSPSAIQVKNWRKAFRIEEKLDNSDGVTESAKAGTKVNVYKTSTALSEWEYQKICLLHFLLH
jgi:hypothetical protein